jgi:hypothetical protein
MIRVRDRHAGKRDTSHVLQCLLTSEQSGSPYIVEMSKQQRASLVSSSRPDLAWECYSAQSEYRESPSIWQTQPLHREKSHQLFPIRLLPYSLFPAVMDDSLRSRLMEMARGGRWR